MIKQLVSQYVATDLKEVGFKKNRLVWNRPVDSITHVIEFQQSQWNDSTELQFTINIGVLSEQLWKTCNQALIPKTVREVDCFPRYRIGDLLSSSKEQKKDKWWALRSPDDINETGVEVNRVIQETCLPLLDRCNSHDSMLAIAGSYEKWHHPVDRISYSVLIYLVGRKAEAAHCLTNLEESLRSEAWRRKIRTVREHLE